LIFIDQRLAASWHKYKKAFCLKAQIYMWLFAILPQGSVRDETTFFVLLGGLVAFIGAAIYLRLKRRREEEL
jgi:LPXTG-motif cell wall-anchored protein